jgi:hypothetical protein
MDFIVFTKTYWDEAPRIRHQIVNLLASHGHDVWFFEKPFYLKGRRDYMATDRIRVSRTRWLIHPQLRINRPLARLEYAVEKREMRRMIDRAPDRGVITFNYEHEYLRELFPVSRIALVLNDDFIDGALSPRETAREIGATAAMADQTLVTSEPISKQVAQFTNRCELFLPWSRSGYRRPRPGLDRPDLLYWGYINDRIDEAAARHVMDSGITIHFVGPVVTSPKIRRILGHQRAVLHAPAQLADLQIIDRCCASFLPYDMKHRQVAATTITNRSFELLSYGLPLLFAKLPALIEAPSDVIHPCGSPQDYVDAYRAARDSFDETQDNIERFLRDHTPERRYEQLMRHFPG